MAQESTAIRDFIHLAQAKRLDDEPVPDLFSAPPPPQAVSLRPTALPAMPARQYQIPTTFQHEDAATEMWNTAAHDTAPAVPKILPNVATMVAAPPRSVPAILTGPVAPAPAPVTAVPVRSVVLPPVAQTVGFHTRAASIAPPRPAPYLAARELASSAIRSWGGIVVLGVVALGVGAYLAIASVRSDAAPQPPSARDRAIAIMNGTAQPDPPSVKAPEPAHVTAPTTEPVVASTGAITAEPIAEPATTEPAAAEPVSVDENEIEIELEPAAAAPALPAKRASRASRKLKQAPRATRRADPVLAIVEAKPKAAKPVKLDKASKNLVATEIAAPRGAAASSGTGKVTITSDKPALVFLDGRPTGKQAPTALVIPAGDHQITLLDPETKKAKTATIKLEANKSLAIAKLFN